MSLSVLILGGQREGVIDPLCAQAGVERKAVIPINGRPMLLYVLDALDAAKDGAGTCAPYHISGFDASYDARLTQSPSAPGPADSASRALSQGIPFPCLLTTCDHPLLTAKMIAEFAQKSKASGADFCVGLAKKTIIAPAYPEVKRTYLKFADEAVSGCNLFYIANEKGLAAIEFWKQAQHLRKQPVALARSIGWGVLLSYLSRRLTVDGAFTYVSKRLKIKAKNVFISVPEAAIDVDKPSDKILVEQILKSQSA